MDSHSICTRQTPYRSRMDFTSFSEAVAIRPQFPFLTGEPRHYYFKHRPPKEIDRLSRFFWFPPFSIPLCPPRSNKRPCSRESNSLPNKYRGWTRRRRHPVARIVVAVIVVAALTLGDATTSAMSISLHRTAYAYNLLLGSWICLRLSLSPRWRINAVYKHISPLLIHFQGFGIRLGPQPTPTTTYPLILSHPFILHLSFALFPLLPPSHHLRLCPSVILRCTYFRCSRKQDT